MHFQRIPCFRWHLIINTTCWLMKGCHGGWPITHLLNSCHTWPPRGDFEAEPASNSNIISDHHIHLANPWLVLWRILDCLVSFHTWPQDNSSATPTSGHPALSSYNRKHQTDIQLCITITTASTFPPHSTLHIFVCYLIFVSDTISKIPPSSLC